MQNEKFGHQRQARTTVSYHDLPKAACPGRHQWARISFLLMASPSSASARMPLPDTPLFAGFNTLPGSTRKVVKLKRHLAEQIALHDHAIRRGNGKKRISRD